MSLTKVRIMLPTRLAVLSIIFCMNLAWLPSQYIPIVRAFIIGIDSIYLLLHFRKNWVNENLCIIAYGIIICLSGAISGNVPNSVLYALMIITSYIMFDCAKTQYGYEVVVNCLYKFLFLIMLVVDWGIVLTHGAGTKITGRTDLFYYIGSKFTVSYFNMLLFSLYLERQKKKRIINIIILATLLIYVNYLVDCMTGVMGVLAILLLYCLKDKFQSILGKPIIAVVAIVLSGLFAVFSELVTNIGAVQWFVQSVLHSDLDLTGRTSIFAILINLAKERPLMGYGYGNTAVKTLLGYGNPQNGFFDILISYGLIGLLFFLLLVYISFASRDNAVEGADNETYMAQVFIYAMILCGTVEINFSILFVIGLALIKEHSLNRGGFL